MLDTDWEAFGFSYTLDLTKLVPHIVALETYKAAALAAALPAQWLEQIEPAEFADGEPRAAPTQSCVPNTNLARSWIAQRFAPGSEPPSLSDILVLHRMVADQSGVEAGCAGALRTTPVRVGRSSVGGFHVGAPAEWLAVLMDQYLLFIDSPELCTLPPVIHALLAHYFLSTIHPFMDGNGRVSRLITAAILSRRGYNLQGSYALTGQFYNRALRYHTILHRSWQRCPFDVTQFVAFGIEGFVTELRSVDTFLQMKLKRTADHGRTVPVVRRRTDARRPVT